MSEKRVEAVYISGGCNRCPRALDWGGAQDQIVYALNNSVALLSDQEPYEVKCTFNKHTDRVNSVRWISRLGPAGDGVVGGSLNEFVSASKDKTVVVWQGRGQLYEPVQVLQGHSDNVCVVDAMYYENSGEAGPKLQTILASGSVDSTVRIWTRQTSDLTMSSPFTCDQELKSKANGFALALKFYLLPLAKLPLLLIGYENHKIEIHVQLHNEKENKNSFYCLHTLVGHEDWIRDIDVCQPSAEQLLIASSSQDNYIRLWKLDSAVVSDDSALNSSRVLEEDQTRSADELKAKADDSNGQEDEDEEELAPKVENELKLKSSLFTIHSRRLDKYVQYSMSLESVLYGHEDWIYTVKFQPPQKKDGVQPLTLISASIDKTIVVWKYDNENAIWIDSARVGDIGGTTLGFYGATFDPSGSRIIAHGYQGALHLWKRETSDATSMTERLTPGIINGGHFDVVSDICWEPEQQYLLSVSKDQTTRFHAYWKHPDGSTLTWHELGRPQIHGYDLTCVGLIDRFKFVSGADEKLLRIFEAPKVFLQNFYKLSLDDKVADLIEHSANSMPQGASVPALGLSNKAVYDEEKQKAADDETGQKKSSLADDLYKEVYFNIIDLNRPPTEEHLLQNTLWPEVQKLYGHGYELFTVAVDPASKLVASACKATKAEHATVLVWQQQLINQQTVYRQIGALKGHELTIVQIKFSNNGKYLLTVSRDRSWKLFRKSSAPGVEVSFELVRSIGSKNPYHTRIVWSCDWSHDDKYFLTTSRDKRVCVWEGQVSSDEIEKVAEKDEKPVPVNAKNYLELSESITACSFAPALVSSGDYLVALGYESGSIDFFTWSPQAGFEKVDSVEPRFAHHLTVKRLSFRKTFDLNSDKTRKTFHLASCSDDNTVRLYKFHE